MASRNRQLIVTAHGGPAVLRVEEREVPDPAPGEVQVRVAASGVNFKDVYEREGRYPRTPPFGLGDEGAGEVIAVGAGVHDFEPGDRLAWAEAPGSHAEVVNVSASKAVPVPAAVSAEVAAAAMLQGMTAHYLVTSTYAAQEGDAALVHAAAGGVGQLLVQLLVARGVRVIATVSTEEKAAVARQLGAQEVIRYDQQSDLAAAVRAANGGGGVRVVYDGVGQATFEASLASLGRRGLLALFGASSGPVPPFDLQRLNPAGSLFVTRPTLADHVATRAELVWRAGDIFDAIASGTLQLAIGGRYRLDDAAHAYEDLQARRTTGKLLLIP